MFNWLRKRRRKKITQTPFPHLWLSIIEEKVPHYTYLDTEEKARLRILTQIFIAEKTFEGCGGLTITDEIKVVIAAQASLLVLGLPPYQYLQTNTILVYPSAVTIPTASQSIFTGSLEIVPDQIAILGQASFQGPMILVWDAVQRGARHPKSGHNVVYHEFAHILDMRDGAADGTPVLSDRKLFSQWVEICTREFKKLKSATKSGKKTLLDGYGAIHEAEFFAVATELFFDRPLQMQKEYKNLYGVLSAYYQQDTASREIQYRKRI